jgi:hypothetical protein
MSKEKSAFEVMTEEEQHALRRNRIVTTPIARIQTQHSGGAGRPPKYSPKQMKGKINHYFKWCEKADRIPSIKGMMLHMKLHREQFYVYVNQPGYNDVLEQARLAIVEWVENDIYATPGQAAGKIAYAKNVHNWADKIDTTNVNENHTTVTLSVDDAKAKIAALAHLINPELLEAVTSRYVVNQIVHIDAEVVDEGI